MKNKTSKSISQFSHALVIGDAVIPSAQLAQVKGGFVVIDELGGF